MVETTYKCLNPVGIQEPVEILPLAKRLDKLDGKNIVFSVGAAGEQDILIPLRRELPIRYPNVNWTFKTAAHRTHEGSTKALSEEEMKTTDAVMRGVLW